MPSANIKSITIGSFDGIHIAHQELVSKADGVVIIERGRGYLTPDKKRCEYVQKPCFFYYFDDIKDLDPISFLGKLRTDFPSLQKIVIGYDFHFGKNRTGDAKSLAETFDGDVEVVGEIELDSTPVHSRTIKKLLIDAEIEVANKMLGREYLIEGKHVRGQGIGSKELVPTINMKVSGYQLPQNGVYATKTLIDTKWHDSVTFIGNRATTDNQFAIESHIISQNIEEIPSIVKTKFVSRIRDNQKFESITKLKKQIQLDIDFAKGAMNER